MTIHHLDRVVPVKTLDQIARENEGLPDLYECLGAMPSARAAAASRWSLLRVSSIASIAIAVLTALYFAAEFLR
jgi:hypothetical protein